MDTLQKVDGVRIAEIRHAASRYDPYYSYTEINAFEVANAGYYRITDENLTLNFIAYEQVL